MRDRRDLIRVLALGTIMVIGVFLGHECRAQDGPPGGGLWEGKFGPFPAVFGGGATLRVALWNTGLPDETELYLDIVKEFQRKTPGVQVMPAILDWQENTQQIILDELRAQTSPADIVLVRDAWLPEVADELLSLDAALGGVIRRGYPDTVLDACRVDGALLGLPFCARTKCLFYRPKLLRKLNLKPPRTWVEFPGVAQKLAVEPTLRGGFGLPAFPSPDSADLLLALVWAQGGRLVDDEGALVVGRELLEAVELWSDLANVAHATQPMPVSWPQRELENRFLSGELGMLIAEPRLARYLAMRKPKLDYAIIPLPEWNTQATRLSVDCLAVSARSTRPELALRFLRHAGQDRFAKQMCSLGLLSAKRPAARDANPPGNTGLGPFLTSLEYARPAPAELWPTVWPYLANVLVETLAGRRSAEAALRELLPTDIPSVLRLDERAATAEEQGTEPHTGEP